MADNLLYVSLFATCVIWVVIYVRTRSKVKERRKSTFALIVRYTLLSLSTGVFSGTVIFFGSVSLLESLGYRVPLGHGDNLVAAPLGNTMLGIMLWLLGLVTIRWR